jgi:hypothetical protein
MVNRRSEAIGLLTALALLGAAGCDSSSPTATGGDPGTDSTILTDQKTANPPFDAAAFVAGIDNPYLPLLPGTAFHYRSETQDVAAAHHETPFGGLPNLAEKSPYPF